MYKLVNIIPFDKIASKDIKYINNAAKIAEKSSFDSSKKLGACVEGKGKDPLPW